MSASGVSVRWCFVAPVAVASLKEQSGAKSREEAEQSPDVCGLFGAQLQAVLDTNLLKRFTVIFAQVRQKIPSFTSALQPAAFIQCVKSVLQPQRADCSPPQSRQRYYASPAYAPAADSSKSLLQKGMSAHPPSGHPSAQEGFNSKGRVSY